MSRQPVSTSNCAKHSGVSFGVLIVKAIQVFSLAGTRKIKEEGVTFQSHIDGSRHLFTPENVVNIQRTIEADIEIGRAHV